MNFNENVDSECTQCTLYNPFERIINTLLEATNVHFIKTSLYDIHDTIQ